MPNVPPELQAARDADAELMRRAIKRLGMSPEVVIDAGVRAGTPALYRALPKAHFHLIDPQEGGEAELKHKPRRYTSHNVGLAATPGTVTLNEQGAHSSMLERTALTHLDGGTARTVTVTTLDDVIDGIDPGARIALKLDIEGYELEALRGLTRHAHRVDMIICETSVRDRFVGSYSFAELVGHLDGAGFRFYNVLNLPKPKPKRFYDLTFLRSDNPLFQA